MAEDPNPKTCRAICRDTVFSSTSGAVLGIICNINIAVIPIKKITEIQVISLASLSKNIV